MKYNVGPFTLQMRISALISYREDILSDMIKYSDYELLYSVLVDRYSVVDNWIIELRKEE